jgi:hypothetical protein
VSGSNKVIDHILIEARRYDLFRNIERRSAGSDEFVALTDFGPVEPLVGKFRHRVGVFGNLPRDTFVYR